MSVYDKWASIFPGGIAQCLKEYWKERMSTAPLDPRFPNVNQTKYLQFNFLGILSKSKIYLDDVGLIMLIIIVVWK